ncbi:ABC transporter substrate-binding protein [Staphylococcus massiliensis]|uniref:Iron ABC transporter substrate-binding protein n=1 Tax=Staphylococcus massiliensis S46 TaxID=1229783 RepID=K9AFG5_9STAP|nr:ABC transporter substrate-binding protein [Staphylococcus massiliensis]EKU46018.1 iron ABC transporter substrate-binding protein [Staphylococcus massiliensis S46]MCG3400286.1 ABC transporter substrate-binding protein [Staphylococcus massiliensis]MCG3401916.1 ABC transporter substrate-binding protein [Staphylococcus massiliensis]MCG3412422.1 ABC transporter substrate-binding protein [Staphylococcus massiliensis]PNZ98005.1 ABC transporter substrate-binding protein [Staphylococcus massiliensis
MKLKAFYVIIMIICITLAGCSESNEKGNDNATAHQQRIISLMPSNTEILYELGLDKQIVGVSSADDYPKDVKQKKQFDAFNLDKEALLKAKPDLILAHESQRGTSSKVLDALDKKGVKVVYIKDATSINEMYDTFSDIGRLTHKEKAANQLIDETKRNIKKVIQSVPKDEKRKNVFIEVSSKPDIYTAGHQTFFDDMLQKLNAKNSFHDKKGWVKTDKEAIIKRNPDIIINTSGSSNQAFQKLINSRSGFDKVEAVKNKEIKSINGDEISRPGPRIDDGLKTLRDAIYKQSK